MGRKNNANVPFTDKVGKTLLMEEVQNDRWVEYFKDVLSQPHPATKYDVITAVVRQKY